MEKLLTSGNSLMFAIKAIIDGISEWLWAESKFYTDLINAGENEKVVVTHLDAIKYNAYILLGIFLIGFFGSLENMM